jgi:hypothetical protein
MALNGRIEELPASEALGLIGRQAKTGRLEVTTAGERITLYFERGRLVQARHPRSAADDDFMPLLRDLRILDDDTWRALTDWQSRHPDRDPMEFLVSDEVSLARDLLREVLLIHTQGVVDRVLAATTGTICFESTLTSAPFGLPLQEKTEFLMMESGRRNDELTMMLDTDLPRHGVPAIHAGKRPADADPIMSAVLRAVDGFRSVGDILAATHIPPYDVLASLNALVQDDAATVRVDGTASYVAPRKRRGPSVVVRALFVTTVGVALAVSLVAGLKLWGVPVPF